MRTLRTNSLLAAVLLTLLATPAHAVSNRIFMSTNGNNASDCANPLTPCLTFAGALAQVNPGGEVIAEATGGYGALNITQAVTISGPPGVVIYSGLPVNVNAPGATVILRGLTIDGTGAISYGINVVSAGTLSVESCVITGFALDGIHIAGAAHTFVKDTISRQNGGAGIEILSGRASIDHCRFEGNADGVYVDGAIVTVRDSVTAGNNIDGFFAASAGVEQSNLNLYQCLSTNNGENGIELIGHVGAVDIARVSNSSISENFGAGLKNVNGAFESLGNNFVRGNVAGDVSGTITVVPAQ